MTSYADLLVKYKEQKTAARTVSKPLCIVPAVLDEYREAKAEHDRLAAVKAANPDAGGRVKMNTETPLEAARKRLDAAEDALNEVSLVVHFNVPTSDDHETLLAELDEKHGKTQSPTRKRGFLAGLFNRAETVTGDKVHDFGPDELVTELANLSGPAVDDMILAIQYALQPVDFPTSRRP